MKGRIFLTLLITVGITLGQISNIALADTPTEPTFPLCTDLQGTTIASYDEGIHGIPGNPNTFFGSDIVNILSNNTLVQCFCPSEGDTGIQTNWWKADELTIEEIEILTSQGWIYIPDGSAWGLEYAPYLAKNSEYVCKGQGGPGDDEDEDDDDKDSSDDENDKHDAPDEDDDEDEDKAQAKGQVLHLATTGNLSMIASLLIFGIACLGASLIFAGKKRDDQK